MSCTSCKKKADSRMEQFEKEFSAVNKATVGFVIVWSLLALYGLYSLIKLLV